MVRTCIEVFARIRLRQAIGIIVLIAIVYYGLKSGDLIPEIEMPIIPLIAAVASLVLGALLFILGMQNRSDILFVTGIALIVLCLAISLYYG